MDNTLGYVLQTRQSVNPGEEITVDYGHEFFADLPGGCRCIQHNPELDHLPLAQHVGPQTAITPEAKAANKKERQRRQHEKQKKNKKEGREKYVFVFIILRYRHNQSKLQEQKWS